VELFHDSIEKQTKLLVHGHQIFAFNSFWPFAVILTAGWEWQAELAIPIWQSVWPRTGLV
jgi:hypothetical protein